jgi:UDPglucose 6-dehydrogenase
LVLVSSQVPVGTCNLILDKLRKARNANEVCYVPENLRLGNAIHSFLNQERIIVGQSSEYAGHAVKDLYSGVSSQFLFMSLKSAEMAKHALNSYLATMISFSGEISNICEITGANAIDVMSALKSEKRVSPHAPLSPGMGFSGGTLARDVQVLRQVGKDYHLNTVIMDSLISFNNSRMDYVRQKLVHALGSLENKTIVFLGLTYKAGTDTLRRSPTLQVIDQIKEQGVIIKAYDPMISHSIEGYGFVSICADIDEAFYGADAIVIMNDCEEFKHLELRALVAKMSTPIIIDTKNLLDKGSLANISLKYYGVGYSI